ncbi:MAG TPA: hypothetical protein VI172_08455 [Candidatus Dormibacteraeota bacterium]|jgi:hypothetical protein
MPTLTSAEFDLIVKTALVCGAIGAALILIALPWVLGWRGEALEARTADADLMAVADVVQGFGPEQERIP